MAKQKLNIEPKGFPTAMSEPYKSLKGVGSTFINIPLDLLDEIENQPFPINEEKVEQIADSIETVGVIEPLIVTENLGRYKILSGRHRYRACQKLGKNEIPCYIKNVSEDVARYILIATNTDRNNEYAPTVYAKAYAEQLELIKKLGKKATVSAIAEQNGLSRKQIYRYVRLTYLIEDFQRWVDKDIIRMLSAVELSFLSEEKQNALYKHLIGTGIAESAISRNILTVETAKKIHSVADTISDEEFAENIEKIIFGHYGTNQTAETVTEVVEPVAETVEPVITTETAETIDETPMPKEEKTEKPKAKSTSEKKISVTEQKELEHDIPVKEVTDNTEIEYEEVTETADTKDDDFANIIKGYMLIALHDYGMECDKDTIDELYQRVNSSTALDVYNKLSE